MDRRMNGQADDGQKVINIAHPEHSSGVLEIDKTNKTINRKIDKTTHFIIPPDQGPVVQSIVSLTSSLVVKMITVPVSTISNSQVFLLKKM